MVCHHLWYRAEAYSYWGKEIVQLGDKSSPSTPEAATTDNRENWVLQILYLPDKFSLGDSFYHELSMTDKSLP